jgi:hypothetical protein
MGFSDLETQGITPESVDVAVCPSIEQLEGLDLIDPKTDVGI